MNTSHNPNDKRFRNNLTHEQRVTIGQIGGKAVSADRDHMAAIGRIGGRSVSQNVEHMREIGRRGGKNKRKKV